MSAKHAYTHALYFICSKIYYYLLYHTIWINIMNPTDQHNVGLRQNICPLCVGKRHLWFFITLKDGQSSQKAWLLWYVDQRSSPYVARAARSFLGSHAFQGEGRLRRPTHPAKYVTAHDHNRQAAVGCERWAFSKQYVHMSRSPAAESVPGSALEGPAVWEPGAVEMALAPARRRTGTVMHLGSSFLWSEPHRNIKYCFISMARANKEGKK